MTKRHLVLIAALNPKAGSFRIHTLLMARALCEAFDVTLVSDKLYPFDAQEEVFFPKERLPRLFDEATFFAQYHERRDILLYQLGNNDHYAWILDRFFISPGLLLVHDPSFYWLLSGNELLREVFIDEEVGLLTSMMLKKSMGWDRPELASISSHTIYFNRCVLQYAVGILCHSGFQASKFQQAFPEKPVRNIELIPNFLDHTLPPPVAERQASRDKLAISANCTVFSILGYQSFHKRIADLLAAFCALDVSLDIKLIVAGRWDETLKANCSGYIQALQTRKWLILIDDYVSEADLEAYICASNVVVNLRYPTAGESSGIACQALALGTPVLVNTIGAFVDLPSKAVYRMPFSADGTEVSHIASTLHDIITDRVTLARKQAEAHTLSPIFSMSRYARDYIAAINHMAMNYEAERNKVERRLGARVNNDNWPPRFRHHPRADIVIVGDRCGNALKISNPLVDAVETISMVKAELKLLEIRTRYESGVRMRSFDELAHKICKIRDMQHVNISDDPEVLADTGHLIFASRLESLDLTKADYLRFLQALPIGARLYVTDAFLSVFGLVHCPYASEIDAALIGYVREEKADMEAAVFRYGVNFLDPVDIGGERLHVLRKSSDIYDFYTSTVSATDFS